MDFSFQLVVILSQHFQEMNDFYNFVSDNSDFKKLKIKSANEDLACTFVKNIVLYENHCELW